MSWRRSALSPIRSTPNTAGMAGRLSIWSRSQAVTSRTDLCGNCIGMRCSTPGTTSIWATARSRHSFAISSALELGGPLKRDHTFFFVNYEGFREVQASTAIATVPNALAHQGLLPSAGNPSACTNATPSGCVAIPINPLIQQFLNLMPPSNGLGNRDGTGELITANKGNTREDHGIVRIDHNFS